MSGRGQRLTVDYGRRGNEQGTVAEDTARQHSTRSAKCDSTFRNATYSLSSPKSEGRGSVTASIRPASEDTTPK